MCSPQMHEGEDFKEVHANIHRGVSWKILEWFGSVWEWPHQKVYGAKVSSLQLPCGNLRTSLASAEWLGNPNAENFQSFLEKWNYFRHVCTCCPKTIQASKASNGSNGARSEFVPVFSPGLSPAVFACRWQVWKIRKQDIARAPWKNMLRTHSPSRFLIVCYFKDFEQLLPARGMYSEFSDCLMPNGFFLDGPLMCAKDIWIWWSTKMCAKPSVWDLQ